jgi:hypothetical protein
MFLKRSWKGVLLNGLIIALLLGLPIAAGAQTTGTSGSGAATNAAQTNGITSPKDMAALSGTVEVRGYANVPNFMKWQLDLLPNNDPSAAIFLAFGEKAGEFTYSLDTSKLPAGEHSLRLRIVREDSNYDEYFTKFTIGGATSGGSGAAANASSAGTAASGAASGTQTRASATAGGTAAAGAAATSGQGVTTNGLAAPREGQNISGQFTVRGYANDPDFMKWQLDLLPNGNANQAGFLAFGETTGVFTHTLDTTSLPAGQHTLRLRIVRNDSNYSEYFTNFTIGGAGGGAAAARGASTGGGTASGGTASGGTSGGGAAAGGTTAGGQVTNGITAPKEGATVRGVVEITGYANNADFMKWQLDLLPGGNANQAAFLAFGEKPGQFTYTLDTTGLPAGQHALRLRVVRNDSNYDEYVTNFTIAK